MASLLLTNGNSYVPQATTTTWKLATAGMDISVEGMNGRTLVLSVAMAMASPDHLVVQRQAAAAQPTSPEGRPAVAGRES